MSREHAPQQLKTTHTTTTHVYRSTGWLLLLLVLGWVQSPTQADGLVCQFRDYLGSYVTTARVLDVHVVGTTAYLAAADSRFHIVDVSDPTAPVQIGRHNLPTYAMELTVVDTIAYVVGGSSGLVIIDVSDPTDPVTLSRYFTET